MKPSIKRPEAIEVRGCQFVLTAAPMSWSENRHGELRCDKCAQPLAVLFAARQLPGAGPENPRWWVPTALTCACLRPRSVALHEIPRRPRRPKRDERQLEFQT